MVRVSILWLLGEYCERVLKVVLDVLRKMVKIFGLEVRYIWYCMILYEFQVNRLRVILIFIVIENIYGYSK